MNPAPPSDLVLDAEVVAASRAHDPLAGLLQESARALLRGDLMAARSAAEAARSGAIATRDRQVEAEALCLRASAERWLSLFPAARASAEQAALLFAALDDLAGEIRALIVLAHVSGSLACYEDALDAALLATELSRPLAHSDLHAEALNDLGLVHLRLGQFDAGERALTSSVETADRCGAAAVVVRAIANLCWLQVMRIRAARDTAGLPPEPHALVALHDACDRLLERALSCPDASSALPGRCTAFVMQSMALTWLGDPAAAALAAGRARAVADEIGPGWLPAMCLMAEVEIHLAGNDLLRAEQCARDMVATASHFGHERMAADGHLMVARILERRGLVAEALREMHRLQQRQQRALADRTESRQFVVGWRLALRDEQQRVRRLERSSRRLAARHRQLERLTMEDALTGALNRRGIEQEGEALVGSGAVLTVAMIDVDDFKRVNDTCSHAAGDAVLRMLAQAMQVQTRAGDVVGRLAGDEFVILFPSTHLAEATTVCERLSAAIARCAWDTVAPGAAVSVSIGLAEHEPGESLASTLARSDAQMYAAKRRRKTRRVRERTAAAPARDGAGAATERASG